MCLGLPGRIVSVDEDGGTGDVEVAGVVRQIDLSLLNGSFVAGDYILVHSGVALERMPADRAGEAESLFESKAPLGKDGAQDQRFPTDPIL